ncbi:hypothetical protein [Rubinisphaera margarita]|uniref:hypothetical protein n=1 Tax=Rubinisphaera margarita TaxID=2909586 RepID=UPI001EE8C68F|nr:hypothetical protein [Rubinisphaera margarita]MCG6155426.1 hypothetical protein [Rubinisphaera margarita]
MSKSFRKWTALVVAAILLLLAWDWYRLHTAEDKFDHGPLSLLDKRPAHTNTERIEDWSLLINGKTLAGQHHEIRIDEELHFTGHVSPVMSKLPPGGILQLLIAIRPAERFKIDEPWDVEGMDFQLEWRCGAITEDRIIDNKTFASGHVYSPGDYNARIYYTVEDQDAGENTIDLLATCTFTLLAPER